MIPISVDVTTPIITTTQNPLPALRFHSTVLYNGAIWSFGGQGSNSATGAAKWYYDVHQVNPLNGASTTEPMLQRAVAHAHTEILNGYAVTFGGNYWNGSADAPNAMIQVTNLSTGVTSNGGSLTQAEYDACVAKLTANEALVFGGWVGSTNTNKAQLVSIASNGSASVTSWNLNRARTYGTCHVRGDGKVVLIGGVNAPNVSTFQNISDIELVDSAAQTSTDWATLTYARRYHCSRKIGDYVYIFGGTDINESGRPNAIGSIEKLDLNTGTVTVVGQLAQARYHAQSVAINYNGQDYILIAGGEITGSKPIYSIELFDTSTNKSQLLAELPVMTLDHDRITQCVGNKIYILSGEDLNAGAGKNMLVEITLPATAACSRD